MRSHKSFPGPRMRAETCNEQREPLDELKPTCYRRSISSDTKPEPVWLTTGQPGLRLHDPIAHFQRGRSVTRLTTSILLLSVVVTLCFKVSAAEPEVAETRYLTFQLMTGLPGYAGPQPMPGRFALSKAQLEAFVRQVVKTIGATGDTRDKLGFAVGPLCFDMSDQETRQFIRDSFAVALENDVAVAFHIDDSIGWGERKDLLSNPDNIETADWTQKPSTGRAR